MNKLMLALIIFLPLAFWFDYRNTQSSKREKKVEKMISSPNFKEEKESSDKSKEKKVSVSLNCKNPIRIWHRDITKEEMEVERDKVWNNKDSIKMTKSYMKKLERHASSHHADLRATVPHALKYLFNTNIDEQFREPALKILLSLIDDPEYTVRYGVCEAGMISKKRYPSLLSDEIKCLIEKCANDSKPLIRSQVGESLEWADKLSNDSHAIVRSASTRVQFTKGSDSDKEKKEKYLNRFIHDPDASVRVNAIYEAKNILPTRIITFLGKFKADDSHPEVKKALVSQTSVMARIAGLGVGGLTNHLLKFKDDKSPEVRAEVANQIGYADEKFQAQVLEKYVEDPSFEVRRVVAYQVLWRKNRKPYGINRTLAARIINKFEKIGVEPDIQKILNKAKLKLLEVPSINLKKRKTSSAD